MFIGGSATNDGGIGMAAALGVTFNDSQGQPLEPIGESLKQIKNIKSESLKGILQSQ